MSDHTLQEKLEATAKQAANTSYSPYSHFAVGAAILTRDGRIFAGANIENASFGLTNCAERTAIFKAVSEGCTRIDAIAVVAGSPGPVPPCGACRQVMAEFCRPDTPVYLGNLAGTSESWTVGRLLPGAFSSADLQQRQQQQ